MKWISVKDAIPELYADVLVYPRPSDYTCEAFVSKCGDWFYSEYEMYNGHVTYRCTVTHWMHMPEEPQE